METTPSGPPAISPSRREIGSLADFAIIDAEKEKGWQRQPTPNPEGNSPANYLSCFNRRHSSSSCSSDR
jgi:hypothetical protein